MTVQHFEARLWGMNHGENWETMCATTPGQIDGRDIGHPTSCVNKVRLASLVHFRMWLTQHTGDLCWHGRNVGAAPEVLLNAYVDPSLPLDVLALLEELSLFSLWSRCSCLLSVPGRPHCGYMYCVE